MAAPLRLAIAGTLHPHSALYQELLSHIPAVTVAGIFDDGGPVVEGLRSAPRYDRLEELIDAVPFDAALLTVPADQGAAAARLLIDAGKHILADKPVCRNAREMREIVESVRRAKVKFAVGYQRRFHPAHQRAKRLVSSGELGPLYGFAAHLVTTDIASRGPDHYLFEKARSGGGVLHWLGCHVIDLLRDLAGCELAHVSGAVSRVSDAPVDVEDVASLSFRLENGAVGSMTVGYAIPFDSDSPYLESPKDSRIVVWGQNAKLAYEPFGDRMEIARFRGADGSPLEERYDHFSLPNFPGYEGWLGKAVVEDFIDSVRQGRTPNATDVDNLRVLEVVDAVYAAAGPIR